MICIEKKNAIRAFYYLMAADGEVDGEELKIFYEICKKIDGEDFDNYKGTLIEECMTQIATALTEEEAFDVIQEGLDAALMNGTREVSNGIPLRLLIWDMLAIAFSNDDYSELEHKLILHLVRTSKMDRSVFFEMEQLIKTAASVNKELAWITTTNKTYAEIRPIVEELEKRQKVIIESARVLIEDEVEPDAIYVAQPKRLDNVKAKIGEKISPIANDFGGKTKKVADDTRKKLEEKINPAALEFKAGANNLFEKLKAKGKKKDTSEKEMPQGNNTEKPVNQ